MEKRVKKMDDLMSKLSVFECDFMKKMHGRVGVLKKNIEIR